MSATESNPSFAWLRFIGNDSAYVYRSYGLKTDQFSLRCLKD
jgi:hypothetical protein